MKIAIKGHPTRGKEVIQILESLGGKNTYNRNGKDNYAYYISNIDNCIYKSNLLSSEYKHYTLEEFEREFPFKIGDKVISTTTNFIGTITKLKEGGWYYVKHDIGSLICVFRQHLKLYKEMKEERNVILTLDKAKEWYSKGGELKEIALQAFTEKELTKVDLPKTWEEYTQQHFHREGYVLTHLGDIAETTITGSRGGENLCLSKKSAEAHLAMIQLEQLRNCWRQCWEPDWNDVKQAKFCVCYYREKFKIITLYETRCFLSFPNYDLALKFLECFRDLIEQAGDLI